jgi:hypothetical protein
LFFARLFAGFFAQMRPPRDFQLQIAFRAGDLAPFPTDIDAQFGGAAVAAEAEFHAEDFLGEERGTAGGAAAEMDQRRHGNLASAGVAFLHGPRGVGSGGEGGPANGTMKTNVGHGDQTTGRKKNGLTLKVCPVLLLVVKVKIEPNILGYSSMSLPFTEDTGLLRQLPIMSQFPFSSGACADLPPARLQYIQQMFAEVIGGGDPGSGSADAGRTPEQTMRWIHDRLFVEGWQIAAVRAELLRARQNVRAIAVTSGKGGVGRRRLR